MKTIKRISILFALVLLTISTQAQTKVIRAKLKVKNVPVGAATDSILVVNSSGLFRHVPKSVLLSGIGSGQFIPIAGGNANDLVIDPLGTSTGIAGSVLTIKNEPTATGTNVTQFIDINKNNTVAGTGDTFGLVLRANNNSNAGNSGGVVGSNLIGRHSGSLGVGFLYGSLNKADYLGSGDVNFLIPTSNQGFIAGTGLGTINYARGMSSTININNPNSTVNYAQGLHPNVTLEEGTINESQVIFMDYDFNVANLGSTLSLDGDFTYLRGGAGSDVVAAKIHLEAKGHKARFIINDSDWESDFNGVVNYKGALTEYSTATNKALTNIEYTDTNYLKLSGGTLTGDLSVAGSLSVADALNNVWVGTDSGISNTTGTGNIASGYQSLYYNTIGVRNVASGYQSLFSNTSGYGNVASGFQSLYYNTIGIDNVAYGFQSLSDNTTGSNNVATGFQSLSYNASGSYNIGVGYLSGTYNPDNSANATGSNSIFIGRDTRPNADGETNQIVIGDTAIGNGSNTATLGNASITDTYLKGDVQTNGNVTANGTLLTGDQDLSSYQLKSDAGLIQINEGNGIGFRLEGKDSANYGNIGLNAVDLSHSTSTSTTRGASGDYSHAEGYNTTASGDYSHAEGYNTTASGFISHAEGRDTTASGAYSHSEGLSTTASGYVSHAEGANTIASGSRSHAEGQSTISSGSYSHAEGDSTIASSYSEHSGGYYNTLYTPSNVSAPSPTDRVFGIGNGTTSSRSDAFTILKNGKVGVGFNNFETTTNSELFQINGDLMIAGETKVFDRIYTSENTLTIQSAGAGGSLVLNDGADTLTSTFDTFITEDVKANRYIVDGLNTAPASATATGVLGEIRYTADYIYVCTATNTWKRTSLSTWGVQ